MKFINKNIAFLIKTVFSLLIVFFLTSFVAYGGWVSQGTPTDGQPPFPITVGSNQDIGDAQIKTGKMILNSSSTNPKNVGLFVIGSPNTGRVGIGLNIPQNKLDVAGNVQIDNNGIIIPRDKIVFEGSFLTRVTQSGTPSMKGGTPRSWITLVGNAVQSPSCNHPQLRPPGPCSAIGYQPYLTNKCLENTQDSNGRDYVVIVSVCYK